MSSLTDIRYRTAAFNWLHEQYIILPGRANQYPDKELLEMRYEKFRKAV